MLLTRAQWVRRPAVTGGDFFFHIARRLIFFQLHTAAQPDAACQKVIRLRQKQWNDRFFRSMLARIRAALGHQRSAGATEASKRNMPAGSRSPTTQ